jgi:Fe-S cluster assembly scaffold protein SufB
MVRMKLKSTNHPPKQMSTRKLTFSSHLQNTVLSADFEGVQEIEVPAGESQFSILQNTSTSQEYVFHLRHSHSQVLITGFVDATGETAPSLITRVIHHVADTKAETLIKTLSRDMATPRYQGLIIIEKQANRAESFLNHHSLLLGTTAKSWTLPSLEIMAHDVKCSHAATVKTLTENDLFYLRSRGIQKTAAEALLIEAFTQFE